MDNFRLNPDDAAIREQEKRLFALDIAARTYGGTGRMDGLAKYAAELVSFVSGGDKPAAAAAAAPPLTLAQLLAKVPKELLRTAKELKDAGVSKAAVAAAHADDDAGPVGGTGGGRDATMDVGGVQDGSGNKGPASLRQAAED